MKENNIASRVTTISLDEYNRLLNNTSGLTETKGALQTTISNLQAEVTSLKEKQPLVKVVHLTKEYERQYDDWNDDTIEHEYLRESKVDFVNLSEVTTAAMAQAKAVVNDKLIETEGKIKDKDYTIKQLRENVDVVQDKLDLKNKELKKARVQYQEDLDEKSETYTKNVESLKKASKEDEKEYKETIKDLKEEIQKVKDNKTDVEIEEKRNKEIKDLKGRIKDLEKMVEDLGKLNFFSRIFKLRAISTEVLAARKELVERQDAANRVGTTYVKENGKYRKYTSFTDTFSRIFGVHFGSTMRNSYTISSPSASYWPF